VSGIAYVIFVLMTQAEPRHLPTSAMAGILLGAGLGVGVGLTRKGQSYLPGALLGGLLAVIFAVIVQGMVWDISIAIIAGIVLGACTGMGFQIAAVEREAHVRL